MSDDCPHERVELSEYDGVSGVLVCLDCDSWTSFVTDGIWESDTEGEPE